MQTPHPAKLQSLVLMGSILLAYVVLHFPLLNNYSLQVFTGSIALFLILKRFKRAKIWHILPDKLSFEVAILTFAFVYLIGATGNTHSVFYPLSYIHLFFLIFSTTPFTAIGTIIFLLLFHYAQEPVLGTDEVATLLSLPIIGTVLLFAKKQYDEVHSKEIALEKKVQNLDDSMQREATLEHAITTFIQPKLVLLKKLLHDPEETKETVLQQLTLMETELGKISDRVQAIGEKTEDEKVAANVQTKDSAD